MYVVLKYDFIYIYIYISLYSDWYCQIPNITLYDIVASHAVAVPRRTRQTGSVGPSGGFGGPCGMCGLRGSWGRGAFSSCGPRFVVF